MLQQNLNNICNLSYTPGQALEHQTLPSDNVFSAHAKRKKKKNPSIIIFRKGLDSDFLICIIHHVKFRLNE